MSEQPPPPPENNPPGGGYPPPPQGGYPPPPPPQGGGYPGQGYGAGPSMGAPPDNNLVWAILSTILCCLPLGIVSIVKSTQVSGLWAQGRHQEAQQAADDAKKFAMWAAIAGVVVAVLWIIVQFVVIGASMSSY